MATQAEILEKITALENARDSGVLRARHGDREVQYRSLAELNAAIAALRIDYASTGGVLEQPSIVRIRSAGRGY